MSGLVPLVIFCFQSVLLAMGKQVSDDKKTQNSWDSHAITPGTLFMDLISSLCYWVHKK
jgi:5'-3' exoribonuclease 2